MSKTDAWFERTVVATILIGFAIVGVFFGIHIHHKQQMVRDTRRSASLLATQIIGESKEVYAVDAWGRMMRSTYAEGDEEFIATVTSAGPDGRFDTADDITAEKVDTNVSYRLGQFLSVTGKEMLRGVADGMKKESRFRKEK